jgi:hypothetical protein
MKDALRKALAQAGEETSVDRIMAVSFFHPRPLQTGATAQVIRLADRRAGANA